MADQLRGENIKLATFNCQGIGGKNKRFDVLNYLKNAEDIAKNLI